MKIKPILIQRYAANFDMELLCTCGYYAANRKEYEKDRKAIGNECLRFRDICYCPKCKTTLSSPINNHRKNEFVQTDVKKNDENGFIVEKAAIEIISEKESIKINEITEYEVEYRLKKQEVYVRKNGELISSAEKHIKEALAFLTVNDVDIPFLNHCAFFLSSTSLGKVVVAARKYSLDMFYNAYHTVKVLNGIPFKRCNLEATTPHEFVQLPKQVWKKNVELKLKFNTSYLFINDYAILRDLSEKYNADDIVNALDVYVNSSLKDYLHFMDRFLALVFTYRLNAQRLINYLTYDIYTFQGIRSPKEGLILLSDYINICDKLGIPFEKYPKCLKMTHDIAARNYAAVENPANEELFHKIVNRKAYKGLKWTSSDKKYCIVVPKKQSEIIQEGKKLSHCADAYLDRILEQETQLVFFRKITQKDTPLLTLELKSNTLCQAYGFGSRLPDETEKEYLKEYAKAKNLLYNAE